MDHDSYAIFHPVCQHLSFQYRTIHYRHISGGKLFEKRQETGSLIFVLGLSFVIMSFIRNQAVTFVIMLGFIVVTLSYFGNTEHGAFDFFALTVPNMFSDVLGHTNLYPYLLQRLTYLFLGLGLLSFTIALVNRLPLHPKKNILLNALGCIILLIGMGCGFSYIARFNHINSQRTLYSERYKKYNNLDKVHLLDQELSPNINFARTRHWKWNLPIRGPLTKTSVISTSRMKSIMTRKPAVASYASGKPTLSCRTNTPS